MFKNPLKYQQGGQTPTQEQQKLLAAFIEWLPKRVKEFQGMQPEQIAQALDGMSKTDEGKKQLQQLMMQFQQEMQGGSQAFKQGGKIHDFICKHAKGGKAGCGCKENGGEVLKGQRGLSSGKFDIPFGAYMKAYFNKRSTPNVGAATNRSFGYSTSNGNEYYLEDANVGRNSVDTWVNVTPQKDTIIMQKLPSNHINDLEDYQMEAIMQRMRPDIKRINNQENGGKVEKAQSGKKVNNNRKTITEVGHGLDKYDAEEMGIDPNTLAGTSSIITAYPNKKPYVVNGQIPFWTRNGLVFNLGGVESDYIEDGTRMGKGVPGRKYKVSSVLDQDGLMDFSYNENAKEFPMISRYASPKDTIYYLDFNDFDKNTLGYEEVRSMYNKAIDQPDTFALNREAYLELQRQKQERAPKKAQGGEIKKKEDANVEMHQQKNKGRGKLSTPVSTTPKDSSKVEYNPSMQTLSFEDENGNNVTWTRNNFWGKPDGTYNWRSGRDVMFFNPNQNEGFIPYSRFKQWGTDIEGSTYLSPEDDTRLKNLYEYARNKKTYIEPHYSWDTSIAKRFWYWLKSLNRDKEWTPGAPTFWEQTFKNGGKIK